MGGLRERIQRRPVAGLVVGGGLGSAVALLLLVAGTSSADSERAIPVLVLVAVLGWGAGSLVVYALTDLLPDAVRAFRPSRWSHGARPVTAAALPPGPENWQGEIGQKSTPFPRGATGSTDNLRPPTMWRVVWQHPWLIWPIMFVSLLMTYLVVTPIFYEWPGESLFFSAWMAATLTAIKGGSQRDALRAYLPLVDRLELRDSLVSGIAPPNDSIAREARSIAADQLAVTAKLSTWRPLVPVAGFGIVVLWLTLSFDGRIAAVGGLFAGVGTLSTWQGSIRTPRYRQLVEMVDDRLGPAHRSSQYRSLPAKYPNPWAVRDGDADATPPPEPTA